MPDMAGISCTPGIPGMRVMARMHIMAGMTGMP